MDPFNMAVYASSMLKQLNDCTYPRSRPAARCEPERGSRPWQLSRLVTAFGAIIAFFAHAAR